MFGRCSKCLIILIHVCMNKMVVGSFSPLSWGRISSRATFWFIDSNLRWIIFDIGLIIIVKYKSCKYLQSKFSNWGYVSRCLAILFHSCMNKMAVSGFRLPSFLFYRYWFTACQYILCIVLFLLSKFLLLNFVICVVSCIWRNYYLYLFNHYLKI